MSDNNPGNYQMPYRNEEYKRLNVQHMMWTALLGGLFPAELTPIVERRMASSEPMIMDVGCGTGIWSLEMATRFPQAGVLGTDIVVPTIPGSMPPNLSFKQLDLNEGMPDEYTGQFDIVHCRVVLVHLEDPPKMVNDLVRCLKPGGLIIVPGATIGGWDEDIQPVTPFIYNPEIDISENIANARNLSGLAGYLTFLNQLLKKPKFRPANVLLKDVSAVENIRFQEYVSPVGWAGKNIPRGEEIGVLLPQLLKTLFETLSEKMIAQGVPLAVVDTMKKRAFAEFEERRCLLWDCTSATVSE